MNLGSSSTLSGFSSPQGAQENPHAKIEMVFRFWGGHAKATESAGGESAAAHHPGVVALIEDAVTSKRGVFLSSKDQIYVSGLKRPADALVVSRQVQLGLQGFRGKHAPGPVAVSIVIDASGNSDAASAGDSASAEQAAQQAPEPPHELVTLLKLAKPAQILLTHDLCQQVAQMKGLPLKSFPGRFGVYEYLWTGEEKLDLLQSEPQLTLAAMPTAPAIAPAKDKNVVAPVVNPPAPAAVREPDHADEPSHADMVAERRPALQSPRVLILAAVGLVVLVAAILIGIHLSHAPGSAAAPANPTAPVSTPAPAQTSAPAAVVPTAGRDTDRGAAERPREKPRSVPAASKPAVHQPAKPVAQSEATQAAVAPAPAPAPAGNCTLGANPGRFVDLAEQARGRGDYTNAIRIFREVLNCDPNNAAAREGLEKATSGAQQSH